MISLEKKIGQLVMIGVEGSDPDALSIKKLRTYIQQGLVGGVILFRDNIISRAQLIELTTSLREAAPSFMPLFIALDQEGGAVQRLRPEAGFSSFLKAQDVSSRYTPEEAEVYYDALACEVEESGFNLNFAPVVDLEGVCPVIGGLGRAYHANPENVVAYAQAFINAHRKRGVLTCLKHFPGHGLALEDTHQGFVDITTTFQSKELKPFHALIHQGYGEMVMMAHVTHQDIDPDWPASLSPHFIGTWLRKDAQYQGVVVSDDLHMGAIYQNHSLEKIILQGLTAGLDLFIFSNKKAAAPTVATFQADPFLPEKVYDFVTHALETGHLSKTSIECAFDRIYALKQRLLTMCDK